MPRANYPLSSPRRLEVVEVYGPEPIGANNIDALDALAGAQLAGDNRPNQPGWGLPGSVENTSQTVFVNPQAFHGGNPDALATLHVGNGIPVPYGEDQALDGFALPSFGDPNYGSG